MVIVVGAGIIGCAIACELSRRGHRVEVFEARRAGSGATFATAGILAPFIHDPAVPALQQLLLESFRLYETYVAEVQAASGVDVEYRRCGTLELALSTADAERLGAVERAARTAGLTTEWRQFQSSRGLLISAQGYVRVEHLIAALRRAAEQRGVIFHEAEPVDRLETSSDTVTVRTGGRQLQGAAAVIAAGSWSDRISPEAVGIRPVRGQLLRVRWDGEPLPHVLWAGDSYVVPWRDGTLLVGATLEDVGFDERVTADGVQQLLDVLRRMLPDGGDATFLEARAGLRPASADGLPVIRASTVSPRVVLATGHYRNGVLLAPVTAQRAADLVAAAHG